MLNRPCLQTRKENRESVVLLAPQPVDRILVLASVVMRPEWLTNRQLECAISEFKALKALVH
jgi:hypothetical protein